MAINPSKVIKPAEPHVLIEDHTPSVQLQSNGHYIYGFSVKFVSGNFVLINTVNGANGWKHLMSIKRPHARALAYLLLLETAGPLERAAVIADARAEGIEIGGITSET